MKAFGGIILVIIGLVILTGIGFGLRFLFFPIDTISRSMDMTEEIRDITLNGENAIYNYEWFKQQTEDIKALYKKEERAKQDVEDFKKMLPENRVDWSRDDKAEYDRLNSIYTGLSNRVDDAIALYNARSQMVNRSIFKDNLPTNLTRAWVTSFDYMRGE